MNSEPHDDLKYDLCPHCGDIKPDGLWGQLNHPCTENKSEYRIMTGHYGMQMLKEIFSKEDPFDCFKELFDFIHFKAMPDYETATWLERNNYWHARQSDIRTMKRLREYMEVEQELHYEGQLSTWYKRKERLLRSAFQKRAEDILQNSPG